VADHSTFVTPTSARNPYFGYPVSLSRNSVAHLRGGRQRKRDLALTLMKLWLKRWKKSVAGWIGLFVIWMLMTLIGAHRRVWEERSNAT